MNGLTRILLSEDEGIIAIIIKDLLGSQGFEVTVCTDGQSARERPQAQADGFDPATYQGNDDTLTAVIELASSDTRSTH
jgi:CheY-like chemotaxis protein